eukprot:TRINITY_DN75287_c0_g1_i1.p1 TRINITY_DN75287_c0_g1~~TRINITY_DN75287_c0_g1_i1.p1  ORF type:complete len:517 (+),score=73.77 TRINITY_DN75287_c0_g1_i1:75-1625(+)
MANDRRSPIISWRRTAGDHRSVCLPCVVVNTCFIFLSIPPTLCFGILSGLARRKRDEYASRRFERGGRVVRGNRRNAQHTAMISFADEKRHWLLTLARLFGDRLDLPHLGPKVWQFLDDHPRTLRVGTLSGKVCDVSISSAALPLSVATVSQKDRDSTDDAVLPKHDSVLGLFVGGRVVVRSAGDTIILHHDHLATSDPGATVLSGQVGLDTTAIGVARAVQDGAKRLVAAGSQDGSVRLWRGDDCIRECFLQEWSEWTGTMYLGHLAPVSAVCVTAEGRLVSGDVHGSVCVWTEGGSCRMVETPSASAVTCVAIAASAEFAASANTSIARGDDLDDAEEEAHEAANERIAATAGFAVGYADGTLIRDGWAGSKIMRLVWKSTSGAVLAIRYLQGCDESEEQSPLLLAACQRGLLRMRPSLNGGAAQASGRASKEGRMASPDIVANIPARLAARQARFDGDLLLVWGDREIAVIALPGGGLRAIVAVQADVCAATVLRPRPLSLQPHRQDDAAETL